MMKLNSLTKIFGLGFMALIHAALFGCHDNLVYRNCEGSVWHTQYHITYESEVDLEDSIMFIFTLVDNSLSPFNSSSVISEINRNESMLTDTLIRRVFMASEQNRRISKGNFDPTVGPLVELWGFGAYKTGSFPTEHDIKEALLAVGLSGCRIDSMGYMIKKSPATVFNFSAITKGLGCDLIAEMMRRNGVANYMIEIGGEIAVEGKNTRGLPWRIQIDSPFMSDTEVVGMAFSVVEPGDCGMATSGNFRNFRILDKMNKKIGHIISPVTGYPVETEVVSATVVAPDCTTADALATACMAMQSDSALAMVNSLPEVEVMLIIDKDGIFLVRTSDDFPIDVNSTVPND